MKSVGSVIPVEAWYLARLTIIPWKHGMYVPRRSYATTGSRISLYCVWLTKHSIDQGSYSTITLARSANFLSLLRSLHPSNCSSASDILQYSIAGSLDNSAFHASLKAAHT